MDPQEKEADEQREKDDGGEDGIEAKLFWRGSEGCMAMRAKHAGGCDFVSAMAAEMSFVGFRLARSSDADANNSGDEADEVNACGQAKKANDKGKDGKTRRGTAGSAGFAVTDVAEGAAWRCGLHGCFLGFGEIFGSFAAFCVRLVFHFLPWRDGQNVFGGPMGFEP